MSDSGEVELADRLGWGPRRSGPSFETPRRRKDVAGPGGCGGLFSSRSTSMSRGWRCATAVARSRSTVPLWQRQGWRLHQSRAQSSPDVELTPVSTGRPPDLRTCDLPPHAIPVLCQRFTDDPAISD